MTVIWTIPWNCFRFMSCTWTRLWWRTMQWCYCSHTTTDNEEYDCPAFAKLRQHSQSHLDDSVKTARWTRALMMGIINNQADCCRWSPVITHAQSREDKKCGVDGASHVLPLPTIVLEYSKQTQTINKTSTVIIALQQTWFNPTNHQLYCHPTISIRMMI